MIIKRRWKPEGNIGEVDLPSSLHQHHLPQDGQQPNLVGGGTAQCADAPYPQTIFGYIGDNMIDDNNITSVKVMRKAYWGCLSTLKISTA